MSRPSIDLGYPTEAQGDLPAFQSIEEEAAFWDTHDLTDLSLLTDEDVQTAEPDAAAQLLIPLNRADRDELDRQAEHRGIAPATLAQDWIHERLRQSLKAG